MRGQNWYHSLRIENTAERGEQQYSILANFHCWCHKKSTIEQKKIGTDGFLSYNLREIEEETISITCPLMISFCEPLNNPALNVDHFSLNKWL